MVITVTVYGSPDVGSQGLVQFDETGVQRANTAYGSAPGGILARRDSDGHYLIVRSGTVHEFDAGLTFVQTLSVTIPGTATNVRSIQFVNGSCYLTWFGSNIVVQQYDQASLALITSYTFANPGTGSNPYVFGVSPDGLYAYCSSQATSGTQGNTVWKLDLLGGTTSLFVTNGSLTVSPSLTGYLVRNVGVRPNGDVLVYWQHLTSGATNGDALILYDSTGVQQWATTNTGFEVSNGSELPPMGTITITNDDTAWLCSATGVSTNGGHLKSFALADGAIGINVASPTSVDTNGTGAGGVAVVVTVTVPPIVVAPMATPTPASPTAPNACTNMPQTSSGGIAAGCNPGGVGREEPPCS